MKNSAAVETPWMNETGARAPRIFGVHVQCLVLQVAVSNVSFGLTDKIFLLRLQISIYVGVISTHRDYLLRCRLSPKNSSKSLHVGHALPKNCCIDYIVVFVFKFQYLNKTFRKTTHCHCKWYLGSISSILSFPPNRVSWPKSLLQRSPLFSIKL